MKVYLSHKSDDKMNINNYRSVSLLPAFNGVFEKIMYERFFSFFDKNNMFYTEKLVFVVHEVLLTLLMKLQNELVKGALMHLRVYCLICVKNYIEFFMKVH